MTNTIQKSKKQFLNDMKEYLMNGGVVYSQNVWNNEKEDFEKLKRTEKEAMHILNNKELLQDVDVLTDELDYFGLELSDLF